MVIALIPEWSFAMDGERHSVMMAKLDQKGFPVIWTVTATHPFECSCFWKTIPKEQDVNKSLIYIYLDLYLCIFWYIFYHVLVNWRHQFTKSWNVFFLPSSDSCKHSIDYKYIFFWKSTLLTLLKPLFLETTAPPPSVLGISAPPPILLGLAALPPGLHRSCNTSSSYALPSTPAPEAAPFSPCQIKEGWKRLVVCLCWQNQISSSPEQLSVYLTCQPSSARGRCTAPRTNHQQAPLAPQSPETRKGREKFKKKDSYYMK